ncbi:MAG: hypothetical protein PHY09_03140 [Desulfuromonadaceae bacterium]|nr:hypothetical protein [Desulfuromonadaceae bacterium]MDD5104489.1 hypothetical protein [Desulfuromonadaceae bacterium]
MDISILNTKILASTAISALKNAYDECSDKTAKESILIAFKAIIQLNQNLKESDGFNFNSETCGDCDPSEYCAAV